MTPDKNKELDFAAEVDFSRVLTNPILDIAARLWEADRYAAFQTCYRSMRRIDDLIDSRKEQATAIGADEMDHLKFLMWQFLDKVRQRDTSEPFRREMIEVFDRFKLPFWPWERLYVSMVYDLEHDGYRSLMAFLRYTEGAAISPAAVFIHLCGVRENEHGYSEPPFDIRRAARPLAVFSYLVHIVRDFQKDQRANLNYLADDVLARHGVTRNELRAIANGSTISEEFRRVMAEYHRVTEYYRRKARLRVDEIMPLLLPRYQLSLEMIYQLYLQVFERIDPEHGNFTGEELNPYPDAVNQRIRSTIETFTPVAG